MSYCALWNNTIGMINNINISSMNLSTWLTNCLIYSTLVVLLQCFNLLEGFLLKLAENVVNLWNIVFLALAAIVIALGNSSDLNMICSVRYSVNKFPFYPIKKKRYRTNWKKGKFIKNIQFYFENFIGISLCSKQINFQQASE